MKFDIDDFIKRMGDTHSSGHRPLRIIRDAKFSHHKKFWGSIPSTHVAGRYHDDIPEWQGPGRYDWWYSDNKQKWIKNLKYRKKDLKNNNWIEEKENPLQLKYFMNKYGLRHDGSFERYNDVQGGVIWLGDSTVFGTGLNIEDSYTYIAHHSYDKFKDLPYINMGFPGSGIQTQYRILKVHIESLRPKYVIHQFPWAFTRAEHYVPFWDTFNNTSSSKELQYIIEEEHEKTKVYKADKMLQLLSTPSGILRYNVNLDALKWICHDNNATFLSIEEDKKDPEKERIVGKFDNEHDNFARDLAHAGIETNLYNSEILKEVLDYCLNKYY